MYAGYLINGQFVLLIRVSLSKPFEAIVKTNRRATSLDGLDCNRRDHSVRTWRRTTAYQNSYSFRCHLEFPTKVTEPVIEFVGCHVSRVSHLFNPGGISEVLRLESDHVFSSNPIALAFNIDHSHACLTGFRLTNLVEPHRHHPSSLNADHGFGATLQKKPDRAIPQVTAIGRIEWDRIGTA